MNYPLTVSEILQKYRGFEGELLRTGFHESEFQKEDSNSRLLFVFSGHGKEKQLKSATFMGYEYGTCEEDCTLFSSIYNEILFGINGDLRKFYGILNDKLLFTDIHSAKSYAALHKQLFSEGKDIEHPNDMKIYEVWEMIV